MNEIAFSQLLAVLKSIDRTLIRIQRGEKPVFPAALGEFYLIEDGQETRMEQMDVKADAKPKKFRIKYFDATPAKNPAPVDGVPALTLLNEDKGIAKVTMSPVEGQVGVFEGELQFQGAAGQTQITAKVDPILGEEVGELVAQSELINVLPADASIAEIEFFD